MFVQFGQFVYIAFRRLILLSLTPALCLVPLSLLASLFFLAFGKC